ncbi:MAG: hypothetical protein M1483_08485 [Actinobacteria bacterium]|nr:hypothetical protein [Actinomycetota bacterium]MCL6105641.1 hypothetical protein [Actinomycetota bacterium]
MGNKLGYLNLTPDPTILPGGHLLQHLASGIDGWALVICLLGLVVGSAAWALGVHSQNYQNTYTGKKTVLVSGLAALVIGGAPAIVSFFYTAGTGIKH